MDNASTANLYMVLEVKIIELEERIEALEAEVARLKFLALPKNMSLQDQSKAWYEHKTTPMTYSEMRERFG
jgi:uncharacterized small protein (DUF1192 family)